MLVKLAGDVTWVGPIFTADGACWSCLALRLRERSWLTTQLPASFDKTTPLNSTETRLRAAASFVAHEVARWFNGDSPETAIWTFDWASMTAQTHPVLRKSRCACGIPDSLDGPQITLKSQVIRFTPPEDPRVASPQATIRRLEAIASPVTGLLQNLHIDELLCSATHNPAIPPEDLRIPGAILRPAFCSGRGHTRDAAYAACLAEAVERYALQFRGDEPRFSASYSQLREAALNPSEIQLFSAAQCANPDEWNRTHTANDAVPHVFDPNETIEWVEGWSLTNGCIRYLPMAIYKQFYRLAGKRWIGDADSNGCAAGSTPEEAILQGLLELIERDAMGIWWYNRIARPAFTDDTLTSNLKGWRVYLQDITTDLEMPVFIAIGINEAGEWIYGSGAHLSRATAIRRAFSELTQLSNLKTRAGSPPAYESIGVLDRGPELEQTVDLKQAIEACCSRLAGAGHEVIVFGMKRPEIDFPVFRVVVPGLRHIKPRFAPGRLYDVPVRLGWIERPRRENEFPSFAP
jgi:ribosomal protein S12 methylthiotransferase accessory factor